MSEPKGNFFYWTKILALREPLVDKQCRIAACERAMALAATAAESTELRYKLAVLHHDNKDSRKALVCLQGLLSSPAARTPISAQFSDLARKAGDMKLAIKFARTWLEAAPMSSRAHVTLCVLLSEMTDKVAVMGALDEACVRIGEGVWFSEGDFEKLIDAAYLADITLVQRISRLAIEAYPANAGFSSNISNDPFMERFYSRPLVSNLDKMQPSRGRFGIMRLFGRGSAGV